MNAPPPEHGPSVRLSGSGALASHHATVLFDPDDGRVAHVHHVLVAEGGFDPDEDQRAAFAREAAEQMGIDAGSLGVLHVDGSEIRLGFRHSVELSIRRLIYEALPQPELVSRRRRR